MESPRRPVWSRPLLLFLAACIGLQGVLSLRDSFRDPFPQDRLPSLGVTADTVIRDVQRTLSRQRRLAGFELLVCAFLIWGVAGDRRQAGPG